VFVAGLRHLIRRVRPDYEWLAALVFGSALVQTASVLMFEAFAGGAALDTFNKPDPTVVRALTVERLKSLNIHTVYPGHGKPFPMEQLIKNN
jgi:hypothetical protein